MKEQRIVQIAIESRPRDQSGVDTTFIYALSDHGFVYRSVKRSNESEPSAWSRVKLPALPRLNSRREDMTEAQVQDVIDAYEIRHRELQRVVRDARQNPSKETRDGKE